MIHHSSLPVSPQIACKPLADATRMIREPSGRWKYVYSEANATEELYNQAADPAESWNLADDPKHVQTLREKRAELRQCALDIGDTGIIDGDGFAATPVDREQLRENRTVSGMGWRWY